MQTQVHSETIAKIGTQLMSNKVNVFASKFNQDADFCDLNRASKSSNECKA